MSSITNRIDVAKSRRIVSEEDYIQALGKIIERDYFPDSESLKQQLAELDKKDSWRSNYRDKSLSSNSSSEAADMSQSIDITGMTVDTFFQNFTSEDNESFETLHEEDKKKRRQLHHWMFENALCIENGPEEKRKAGMLMLYYVGNQVLSEKQRKKMDRILDKMDDDSGFDTRFNSSYTQWPFQVQNPLMFPPTLAGSTKTCKVADTRLIADGKCSPSASGESGLETAKYMIENARSDGQVVEYDTVAERNRLDKVAMPPPSSSLRQNNRAQKTIQISNTSLRNPRQEITAIIPRDQLAIMEAAPVTWIEPPHTPSTVQDSDWEAESVDERHVIVDQSALESRQKNEYKYSESVISRELKRRKLLGSTIEPKVTAEHNGAAYGFVPMSPAPTPDALGMSPLITFGTVLGTPLPLSPMPSSKISTTQGIRAPESLGRSSPRIAESSREFNSSGPHFEMAPESQRDRIARVLDERVKSKVKQMVQDSQIGTPLRSPYGARIATTPISESTRTPRLSSGRNSIVAMSPAAQALAARIHRSKPQSTVW